MKPVHHFDFSSGALCLDFSNTWGDRPSPADDHLRDYRDLLEWSCQAGIVSARDRAALQTRSERKAAEAQEVFRQAVALREAIFRVFATRASGGDPSTADVEILNDALARSLHHLRLRPGGACCEWEWSVPKESADRVLWPVVRSAAELLTSDQVARVRQCGSETCAWLFVDTSRNGRRKWCDMSTCGNRAKAKRYYERHHRKG